MKYAAQSRHNDDVANRTTQVTLPNNLAMVYAYDNANQLADITYKQGSTSLGDLTYTYDNAGLRTKVGRSWLRTGLLVAATAASITLNANNQALAFGGSTMTYDLNGNLATPYTPYWMWKVASATFAANADGTAIRVGVEAGNIWRTIEQPILNMRNIPISHIP